MTERFSIKEGSIIGLSSIYTDNGKVMTQLEVLDVLINQHKQIQSLQFWLEKCREYKLYSRRQLEKENEQLKEQINELEERIK